ncbi:MAG: PAS domain-containing protein [Leptolyngbyaceae cyanobacterium SM1_3_5]|nr:PAS domain-containing protein [Leptolyngbyaceae cyanobacterium SM1_3_5]
MRAIETLVLADGREHTLEVIKTQLKADGAATHLIGIALDVTDRIAAETALRHSEETLRIVVQNMPVMLDAYDANTNLIVWNRECERVTGFRAEEITHNSNSLELLYPEPDYRAEMLRQWAEHAGDFRDWEWDITCKDGTRKTILWSNVSQEFPIPGWAGWAIGIDITDRKIAEQSLRQSEERYRTLVDNLPGAVYRCANDRDWTASYLSDRIFEITGYLPSDLMPPSARAFSSIVHPDDASAVWKKAQQAIAIDGIHQDEYRIIHASGEIRWILDREQICCAPDGTILWIDGILLDITVAKHLEAGRKRAEEQLRDLSDRLSLALKSGAIGVWEWDIATGSLIWDDRTCELHGVDQSAFTGVCQDWNQHVHPDDCPEAEATVQKALEGKQDYDTEFRVVLPDGSIRFIKASAIVQRNAAGEPQRMIGINLDVSMQRQAEAKLRQANETLAIANLELARANRLKDEFLANMSHELRTPLSAMLGLSRALQAETFGSLNDRQRQFVETISSSGDHLLALINDILDLAKIESGRFELEFAAVPIHGLCQTSLAFVQPLAEQKNIAIEAHLPPSCLAVLDERRICQVLINLLSNAVKFTPPGGQVTLNVEIDPPVSIRFSVIDTGIGIAPDDQALLFQPFMQIDSSLSRHHDGTGLGLALVKQIVELHEGRVSVESEVGKGSCFCVALPYRSLRNL